VSRITPNPRAAQLKTSFSKQFHQKISTEGAPEPEQHFYGHFPLALLHRTILAASQPWFLQSFQWLNQIGRQPLDAAGPPELSKEWLLVRQLTSMISMT